MRFKAGLNQSPTFARLVASLSTLGAVAWLQFSDTAIRFTIIPEQGTQVWSVLSIDTLFTSYSVQSAAPNNTINLEVPLAPLLRALRSANSPGVANPSIRLTKTAAGAPALVVSITQTSAVRGPDVPVTLAAAPTTAAAPSRPAGGAAPAAAQDDLADPPAYRHDRETLITQTVPIRVISGAQVASLHEPRCREPDVNILLPPLAQLKAVSDRFTRLAASHAAAAGAWPGRADGRDGGNMRDRAPKLELSATMHGTLRLSLATPALTISSTWRGLTNPELREDQFEDGAAGVAAHPSTRMRQISEDDAQAWAPVRVDGRDWSRVLGVGRVGGRVIACFCRGHALVLYVYLGGGGDGGGDADGEESVLTYYVSSYSL